MIGSLVSKPTFASAMKMFTKARAELEAAQEVNASELAIAQATVDSCTTEDANIKNALTFLNNLTGNK